MNIILYSTKCPKCIILEKKLKAKNIIYKEENDIEVMREKGFLTVPVIEVDGTVITDFKKATDWVNSL